MQKRTILTWLGALAFIGNAFAQDTVYIDTSGVATATNVTLSTQNLPVQLLGVKAGTTNIRVLQNMSAFPAEIFLSSATNINNTVTNAFVNNNGIIILDALNSTNSTSSRIEFSRQSKYGLFKGVVFAASPNGSGTNVSISLLELKQ